MHSFCLLEARGNSLGLSEWDEFSEELGGNVSIHSSLSQGYVLILSRGHSWE